MLVVLCMLCVVATVWDLKWRRIPNWLIVVGLVAGLFFHLLGCSLADGLLGLLLGGVPWLLVGLFRGSVGGGDIKFYAMCGFLLGLQGVMVSYCVLCVLSVVLLGGLCLCGRLCWRDTIPFGPLIALATVIAGVICYV